MLCNLLHLTSGSIYRLVKHIYDYAMAYMHTYEYIVMKSVCLLADKFNIILDVYSKYLLFTNKCHIVMICYLSISIDLIRFMIHK